MKKAFLSFVLLPFSFISFAQLLTFDFAGAAGNEATFNSNTNATGVQPAVISRGSGVNAGGNADRFNSNGWSMNATIDVNDYVQFTITPLDGYTLDITNIIVLHQRSTTGPVSFVVRTNLDEYAANATNVITIADVATTQNSTFTFAPAITTTSALTMRLYGYSAEGTTGTWGPGDGLGNDIVVNGSADLTALPVHFGMIKASQHHTSIKVEWNNMTETEVVHYTIESSANGREFSAIGKVNAKWNYGGRADYNFIDASPLNGLRFYRIQSLELTGETNYSAIVKVNTSNTATQLVLYPNPVQTGVLNFQATGLAKGKYVVSVFNTTGQQVYTGSLSHAGGSVSGSVTLPANMKAGTYLLQISNGYERMSKGFVVEK